MPIPPISGAPQTGLRRTDVIPQSGLRRTDVIPQSGLRRTGHSYPTPTQVSVSPQVPSPSLAKRHPPTLSMPTHLTGVRSANTAPPPLSSSFWQQVRLAAASQNRESQWESLAATSGFDPNKHGGELLDQAIQANDTEVCRFLLTHGAKPGLLGESMLKAFQPGCPLATLKNELAFARQREWLCSKGDIRSAGSLLENALQRGSPRQISRALEQSARRDGIDLAQMKQPFKAYPVLAKALALQGINTTENSHWQRRMAQRDEGLRLWLKNTEQRYFSRTGESDRNHNGTVTEVDGIEQPILCRHMVMAYNGRPRPDGRALLASRSRMAKLSWNQLESCFDKLYQSSEQHLVPCNQFDRFLRDQFDKMHDGQELRRQFVITSLNHAMHLTLERKYGQYALSFYDPNSEVDCHLRLNHSADLPKHISSLIWKDYSSYFPGLPDDSLMARRSDANTPSAAPRLTVHQSDATTPLPAGALIHLANRHLPPTIQQQRGPETPAASAAMRRWFRELATRNGARIISDYVYFTETEVLHSLDLDALLHGTGPGGISLLDELLAKHGKNDLTELFHVLTRAEQTLTVSPTQARLLAQLGIEHSAYRVK